MATKKKAAKKISAKAKAGTFARGDRVRITTEGAHLDARGLVRSQDGDAVTVELFRPKGKRYPKVFNVSELKATEA